MKETSLIRRMVRFVLVLGVAIFLIYGLLPKLTRSVGMLQRLAVSLEETGIDPTRYYYTDVEQVKEAELYLQSALKEN